MAWVAGELSVGPPLGVETWVGEMWGYGSKTLTNKKIFDNEIRFYQSKTCSS